MRMRYWLKTALEYYGTVVLITLVYTLLFGVNSGPTTLKGWLELVSWLLWLFGSVLLSAYLLNVYGTHLPVTVGFGSTRNEALAGIHLFRLIPLALTWGVNAILGMIGGNLPQILTDFPLFTGIFLIAESVATVLSLLGLRFGRKIMGIVTALIFGTMGGMVGFLSADLGWIGSLPHQLNAGGWTVLLLGIGLYLLCSIPEYTMVRRYQVKL